MPGLNADRWVADRWGTVLARCGINRMNYSIEPGLYAAGNPDEDSEVLVTANYKLTFDSLRRELTGIDAWILVLDTAGVNVWCAAGKGTFGTGELVRRIEATRLAELVRHRRLILPQLGAVGIAAHEIRKSTGFKVMYGPVRARDLPEYLASGMVKTDAMREVRFNLVDRAVLIPIELVHVLKYAPAVIVAAAGLDALGHRGLSVGNLIAVLPYLGALVMGTVAFPLVLPWLPGRAFSIKGGILGLLWSAVSVTVWAHSIIGAAGLLLVLTPVTAFLALNFTGSTTFTSQSGVKKETAISVPIMAVSAAIGIILSIAASIFRFSI